MATVLGLLWSAFRNRPAPRWVAIVCTFGSCLWLSQSWWQLRNCYSNPWSGLLELANTRFIRDVFPAFDAMVTPVHGCCARLAIPRRFEWMKSYSATGRHDRFPFAGRSTFGQTCLICARPSRGMENLLAGCCAVVTTVWDLCTQGQCGVAIHYR
jgi:hypothetical protein